MHGIPAAEYQNGDLPCRRGTITGAFSATSPSARTFAHQNARILVLRASSPRCRGRNVAHYCADVERGHQNARDPCRRTPEWRPALPARHHSGRVFCHGPIGEDPRAPECALSGAAAPVSQVPRQKCCTLLRRRRARPPECAGFLPPNTRMAPCSAGAAP